jgi:hypothetical protein
VSESLLQDQEEIIQQIIPRVTHIHARIGQEQAPQVNDPFAPEWSGHMKVFLNWWKQMIIHRQKRNLPVTITPEFGPAPYMPTLPYSQLPTSDQWMVNIKIRDVIKNEIF